MTSAVRHLFPGANTPQGFFSYFRYILPPEKAQRIVCVKGGPGTGKSTFMRRIAEDMADLGCAVEYFHCSSDPDSLDGIAFPELKIAFLDGTAPHVVDPVYPGAVDEIINLGEFWSEQGLKEKRESVMDIVQRMKPFFASAYACLKGACSLLEDSSRLKREAISDAVVRQNTQQMIEEKLSAIPYSAKAGQARKLFATAITPKGHISYVKSALSICRNVVIIKDESGWAASDLMEHIMDEVLQRGMDVEAYYCPMWPDKKVEHLCIPDLDLAFTLNNAFHPQEVEATQTIDLQSHARQDMLESRTRDIVFAESEARSLLFQACETISESKTLHDELEQCYIPNMDFDAIQDLRCYLVEDLKKNLSVAADIA